MPKTVPVILSGGAGTRLWPLSRAHYPKQFLPLVSERSLFQETALRFAGQPAFAPPLVIANEDHRFIVAEQLQAVGIDPQAIVLEPAGRNTAPAAAVAALTVAEQDSDALILILPSDHLIADPVAFLAAVAHGVPAAAEGHLMTFGIVPDSPHTGFGYIRRGAPLDGLDGCWQVARFIEKPDRERARMLIADGDCYWNSGIFLFGARRYLEELERFQPGIVEACRAAVTAETPDLDYLRLDPEAFLRAPSISIDYAVMEHTERAAMIPADIGWNDLGSWLALWQAGAEDGAGNVAKGHVVTHATRNSYIRSDGPLVAALGLDNMVVVATDDAVLVAARDAIEDVRAVVDALKTGGHTQALSHALVHRPWGAFRTLILGDRYQVKRVTVKPGHRLSLQMHHHRAEHWVVTRGTAEVEINGQVRLLTENESVYIPLGAQHRLSNPGKLMLEIVEIQVGSYLGEDDIVRFIDDYRRPPKD